MRAIILDGEGGLTVEERARPVPGPSEALVRVSTAGICATDLELKNGYMGFRGTPGHEFVGRVEAAASAEELVGKRVVADINAACGQCDLCARDLGRHCPHRTVLGILGRDGAFADYLAIPCRNLHVVPDVVPDDRAVFVEPLAAAFEILEQVEIARGAKVLVQGDGRLGALCARVLQRAGATVTVLGRHPRKLDALATDGLRTALAGGPDAPASRSFDLVVEATGSPDGFAQALGWLRPRGTLVLKTTCAGSHAIDLAPVVIDEVTVVGSRCGPFEPALAALAAGALRPEETIDGRFPLERAAEAFARAQAPGVRKVLLDVHGTADAT